MKLEKKKTILSEVNQTPKDKPGMDSYVGRRCKTKENWTIIQSSTELGV